MTIIVKLFSRKPCAHTDFLRSQLAVLDAALARSRAVRAVVTNEQLEQRFLAAQSVSS